MHFPLQCCVDYRGFRLVASSLLPIEGASTLVYGICDPTNFGREEIKNGDKDLGVKLAMARVAAQMNLKPHLVGPAPYTTSIHHCVDLEVHRSQKDTKVYCLDFARVMPPEWAGQGGEKVRMKPREERITTKRNKATRMFRYFSYSERLLLALRSF